MTDHKKYYAGVDVGSASIKAVLIRSRQVVASEIMASGGNYKNAAQKVLEGVLTKAGVDAAGLSGIVVTGLGAESAPKTVSLVPRLMAMSPERARPSAARLLGLSPENAMTPVRGANP